MAFSAAQFAGGIGWWLAGKHRPAEIAFGSRVLLAFCWLVAVFNYGLSTNEFGASPEDYATELKILWFFSILVVVSPLSSAALLAIGLQRDVESLRSGVSNDVA
jgi:hypothetical protein